MKRVYLLILILILTTITNAGITFEAYVDQTEAAFEDRIRINLDVRISDHSIETRPLPPPDMVWFNIAGSRSIVEREGDILIRKYAYDLVPRRSGRVTIPPFLLIYTDSLTTDTLKSEPIAITIAEPKPKEKDTTGSIWLYIIAALFLIVGTLWWIKRTKQVEQKSENDWRDGFHKKLRNVKQFAERQNYTDFATEAVKLITSVLEKIHNTNLKGSTISELVNFINEKYAAEIDKNIVQELLEFCETTRYTTGGVIPEQGKRALAQLERIMELLLK